ncbi:MAG: MBL fold metallo-hydrolase [Prevotella sp.]|nr:MBL fold metallo-hydrolase [Prevotella sp.]
MLNIQKYVCNPFQENTYIVSDETGECIIIDCGAYYDNERMEITEYIMTNALTPVRLLCTHGHFDHCMGNDFAYAQYGLKAEVSGKDEYLMVSMAQQARNFLGIEFEREVPPVGKYLTKDDVITFGTHELRILETPGHTPGSVTFYCEQEKVAFTGDTLFQMSIGRTDFEGGSFADMTNSLRNVLAKLPEDTTVYSGHGGKTTIGRELASNPYLR